MRGPQTTIALLFLLGSALACNAQFGFEPDSARNVAGAATPLPKKPDANASVTDGAVPGGGSENAYLDETMRFAVAEQKKWKLSVFATESWVHDSNVFLSNTNKQADSMWTFRPEAHYVYGSQESQLLFGMDAAADFNWFARQIQQDTTNEFVKAQLRYRSEKTTVTLAGNFSNITGGDLDIGGQAKRLDVSSSLDVRYQYSDKVRFGLSGSANISDYTSLNNISVGLFGAYADYVFSPALTLGLQLNQVQEQVTGTGSQSAQQALVRVEWNPLPKLSIGGAVGAEFRHTRSNSSNVSPNGMLNFAYEVGPKTKVKLDVYSRPQNSPSLTGEYFESRGAVLGVSQDVGEKFSLGVDLGDDSSVYHSSLAGLEASRKDQVYYVRPWIRYSFFRHASLELFYQQTTNDSTGAEARPFERDLLGGGLTLSW